MKKTRIEERTVRHVVYEDIVCNQCGNSCKDAEGINYEGLLEVSFCGGYAAKLGDMVQYQFSLCEDCLGKMFDSFAIPPENQELSFDEGVQFQRDHYDKIYHHLKQTEELELVKEPEEKPKVKISQKWTKGDLQIWDVQAMGVEVAWLHCSELKENEEMLLDDNGKPIDAKWVCLVDTYFPTIIVDNDDSGSCCK